MFQALCKKKEEIKDIFLILRKNFSNKLQTNLHKKILPLLKNKSLLFA